MYKGKVNDSNFVIIQLALKEIFITLLLKLEYEPDLKYNNNNNNKK